MRPLGRGSEVVPGYEVIALISRSNGYDVYDAWSLERSARVAVKVVRPDRRGDAPTVRRLLSEGRLLRRLRHPNLVACYEVHTEPRAAIVIETIGGETLQHLIDRLDRLPAKDLGQLGFQLSAVIGYLHRQGRLHLDLKPANVIAEAGRAKLIDLSHARRPGRVPHGFGTWCYESPEQARGGRVDEAADVWGIGGLLFEAATGECAFDDDSEDWDYPQLHRPAAPVRSERRGLPRALADVIDAALSLDPATRPSLRDLAAACEDAAGLPTAERRFS
jgi:serine/threonine protein kinase